AKLVKREERSESEEEGWGAAGDEDRRAGAAARRADRGALSSGIPPRHRGAREPVAAARHPPRDRADQHHFGREEAGMRGRRKVRTGGVVSDKMQKTVTVSLVRR